MRSSQRRETRAPGGNQSTVNNKRGCKQIQVTNKQTVANTKKQKTEKHKIN